MLLKEVKIYTMPTCPHCKTAKEYLSQKGINYKEVDVSQNREAAQEMIQISGARSVPVIVIGDEVIVGFDSNRIDQALIKNS
jgi:glutaredoxin-like YruB-family protein